MAALKAPRTIISEIEKIIRSFLWKGNMDSKRKIPLVSLQNICKDKQKGGAGMHDMSARNVALGAKLV